MMRMRSIVIVLRVKVKNRIKIYKTPTEPK